ncbi:MAG: hypothetical protein AMXMBFR33_00280 [Candidatus Xenobia bacterium]
MGRNLHQVKFLFLGYPHRLTGRHDAELVARLVDESDLSGADLFVDPQFFGNTITSALSKMKSERLQKSARTKSPTTG